MMGRRETEGKIVQKIDADAGWMRCCSDLRRGVVFSFPTLWARRTFQFNFQMGRTKAYLWNARQEEVSATRLLLRTHEMNGENKSPFPPLGSDNAALMLVSGSRIAAGGRYQNNWKSLNRLECYLQWANHAIFGLWIFHSLANRAKSTNAS
jgi:hypothetical protein